MSDFTDPFYSGYSFDFLDFEKQRVEVEWMAGGVLRIKVYFNRDPGEKRVFKSVDIYPADTQIKEFSRFLHYLTEDKSK
jgi:hypothetical protein